jgi:hypothetical protein
MAASNMHERVGRLLWLAFDVMPELDVLDSSLAACLPAFSFASNTMTLDSALAALHPFSSDYLLVGYAIFRKLSFQARVHRSCKASLG